MQIVIDISKEMYRRIKSREATVVDYLWIGSAVYVGTPLPKGHGALKDIDAIISEHAMTKYDWSDCVDVEDLRKAPTIIEADKEDE